MFNLRRYFSVASFTAFAIAIPVMGLFSYQRAVDSLIPIVEQENEILTETLGKTLWSEHHEFLSSSYLLTKNDLRFSPAMFELRESIFAATYGLPVVKLKMLAPDGRILYSTVPREIGGHGPLSPALRLAQSGVASSSIQSGASVYADTPTWQHHRLVLSYVPIHLQGEDELITGIMVLYTDVTPAVMQVKRTQMKWGVSLGGLGLVLYLTLFLIISRADRILQHQHQELERTKESLAKANLDLEDQVLERTSVLQTTNQQLQKTLDELTQTQAQLIHTEKMSSLGQLIAGIAHEVNTPLGAIASSAGSVSKFLDQMVQQAPAVIQNLSEDEAQHFLTVLQASLQPSPIKSTKEERQLRRSLLRILQENNIPDAISIADTLVDMGIETHNVAVVLPLLHQSNHEQLLETIYKLSSIKRGITTIEVASERASKVMFALKNYARYDHTNQPVTTNILDGIETTLTLYHHHIKRGVEVTRQYDALPLVECYADELTQVWTNLIHNALQAMEYQGRLSIVAETISHLNGLNHQGVQVSITDSGPGIPEAIRQKIFEPFFTTKAAGEGSGLGLDIVKSIIDKHGGTIAVHSIPGQTTFLITLPIVQSSPDTPPASEPCQTGETPDGIRIPHLC